MSINSMPLEIGIAKASGMKNFSFKIPEMKGVDVYDNLYKSLNKSIKFAIKTLKRNHKDFLGCYIHFKETDVPGHDNKPYEKKNMLEIIDKKFFSFLNKMVGKYGWRVVVTCDHSTPCKLKSHSSDPVPVLVYDGESCDEMTKFNEKQARAGSLGKMYGKEFMKRVGLDK
jgi:2,3-bisphosphoglycerate-independent phosphoglycerate mutase